MLVVQHELHDAEVVRDGRELAFAVYCRHLVKSTIKRGEKKREVGSRRISRPATALKLSTFP